MRFAVVLRIGLAVVPSIWLSFTLLWGDGDERHGALEAGASKRLDDTTQGTPVSERGGVRPVAIGGLSVC